MSQPQVTPTVTLAATPVLFSFPPQAKVGRVVAKNKIYERSSVSSSLRDKFVAQVEQITWQYKLAPETINLPARGSVVEIQIFDIALKTAELDEEVLRAIDRAIPLPIIFQLNHQQRKLELRLHKEIQFNRKVALNAQLRELNSQIDQLSA